MRLIGTLILIDGLALVVIGDDTTQDRPRVLNRTGFGGE